VTTIFGTGTGEAGTPGSGEKPRKAWKTPTVIVGAGAKENTLHAGPGPYYEGLPPYGNNYLS
jgi:hypothetical protein